MARHYLQLWLRLSIHAENCPEAVIAWYACARIGAVGVTTNTVGMWRRRFLRLRPSGSAFTASSPCP